MALEKADEEEEAEEDTKETDLTPMQGRRSSVCRPEDEKRIRLLPLDKTQREREDDARNDDDDGDFVRSS